MLGFPIWLILILILLSWLIWAFQYYIFSFFGSAWKTEMLGTWGDSFGALNALFAALACFGVIATLRMQYQDLQRQRKLISHQKFELRREKNERDREKFEAHFFQLLSLLRQLKAEIAFSKYPHHELRYGQNGLRDADAELCMYLDSLLSSKSGATSDDIVQLYTKTIHSRAEDTLGPYFRIVYSILRRISESKVLNSRQKASYANLVRSQLSTPEVRLIAANALTPVSNNFKIYVTEFRILKYLPEDKYRECFAKHYPKEAFEARD